MKFTQLLRESIEQHKRKVYLKAAIDMATAYSRRGYTQDEAIKDAAKGIENVYGYVLTPKDIEAVKHFVPENPQFKEIVVKPTLSMQQRLEQDLVDAMYDDCIENYQGDYEEWVTWGIPFEAPTVKPVLNTLADLVGKSTAEAVAVKAIGIVEKMLEDGNLEEIIVKPTHNFEFKIGDLVRYEDEGVFGELGVLTVLNRVESWDAVPAHNPEGVNLDYIDPEEFESSNWYLLDMGGGRKTWEAADYLEPISSDLDEIVVKPTDPSSKLKQELVDAMYDDCWNFSDGDFDDWFENGFDNGDSFEVEQAYSALQDAFPNEATEFYYEEAPYIVEKMLKDENLDEIVVKPSGDNFKKDVAEFIDDVINYLNKLSLPARVLKNGGMVDYIADFAQDLPDELDNDRERFEEHWYDKIIPLARANKKSLNTLDDYIEFFNKAKEL